MQQPNHYFQIHEILCEAYGAPFPLGEDTDPMDSLIGNMLSHRTKNERTAAGFANMKALFPTWQTVLDADIEELVQSVFQVTFPGQKAMRIQQVLQIIKDYTGGEFQLDFLKDFAVADALKWLNKLPGVGPKTSAAVLNFSRLRVPALVMDSHHYRVGERLGWFETGATLVKAQKVMSAYIPTEWDAQMVYDHHEALMYHGQKACFPRNPKCEDCVVRQFCEWREA